MPVSVARDLSGRVTISATPPPMTQLDFEEDAFAGVRFLSRAQVAVLAPVVETRRRTPTTGAELGGGLGDVNVTGRYDFTWAGASHWVPSVSSM